MLTNRIWPFFPYLPKPCHNQEWYVYYPIWLCYVASILEEAGHDVKVIDSCAYEYDRKKTIELVEDFSPNIAVLDTSTPSIYNDVEIGSEIKKKLPNCFVVLIGTHPTAPPEETLNIDKNIDAITVGEADYTIRELAKRLSETDLQKVQTDITYRDNILSLLNDLLIELVTKLE